MIYRLLAILALVALIVGVVCSPDRSARAPRRRPSRRCTTPAMRPARRASSRPAPDGKPLYTLDAAQIQQQPNQGTVDLQTGAAGVPRHERQPVDPPAPIAASSPRGAAWCSSRATSGSSAHCRTAASRRDLHRAPGIRHPGADRHDTRSGHAAHVGTQVARARAGGELEGASRAVRIGRAWLVPAVS